MVSESDDEKSETPAASTAESEGFFYPFHTHSSSMDGQGLLDQLICASKEFGFDFDVDEPPPPDMDSEEPMKVFSEEIQNVLPLLMKESEEPCDLKRSTSPATDTETIITESSSYELPNHTPAPAIPSTIGRYKMEYGSKLGGFGVSNGQFAEPSGIAVTREGDVVVADTNNHRIQVFDSYGNFKFFFGEPGKRDGQLLYPNR